MPTIKNVVGHQMMVKVGNGATTNEVFAHPILINTSRGLTITAQTESDELVDTVDQSLPGVTVRRTRAVDVKIDGAGMLHADDVKTYVDLASKGVPVNIKVTVGNATGTGPFILTQFQVSAERAKSAEAQVTFEQAGAITWAITV